MRLGDTSVLWGSDKLIIIDHVPQSKIDNAKALVRQAIKGAIGFCYREVLRYPLATGRPIRDEIQRLRIDLMNPLYHDDSVTVATIRQDIKRLKRAEREHYSFDMTTYKSLMSNFQKLHKALALLQQEGYVDSFTLRGNGLLKINWFTGHNFEERRVIKQGLTFRQEKLQQGELSNKICVADLSLTNSISMATKLTPHGKLEHEATRSEANSGLMNSADLLMREYVNEGNQAMTKALYAEGAELKQWFIAVMAYYSNPDYLGKVVNCYA
jgi:hypothetical protein